MGYSDLLIRDVITSYGILFLAIALLTLLITRKWASIRRRIYNSYLTGFEVDCSVIALPYKMHLLRPLSRIVSNDELLRSMGSIRILEIGVKTGENILYYPKGAHFIGVDWNVKLREYLANGSRSSNFSHVVIERIIIGDGGSMPEIPTGSVDAVVTTRSMCSLISVSDTLREIHRVLTPGGKYFFMEHLPDHESILIRCCQKVLTRTGIWRTLFGGCRLDFDPIPQIKSVGFERVVCTYVTIDGHTTHPIHLALSRQHVFGVATR